MNAMEHHRPLSPPSQNAAHETCVPRRQTPWQLPSKSKQMVTRMPKALHLTLALTLVNREKRALRIASAAPFRCLILDHRLCPDSVGVVEWKDRDRDIVGTINCSSNVTGGKGSALRLTRARAAMWPRHAAQMDVPLICLSLSLRRYGGEEREDEG